ncbi:MAG: helix-turn-helix domain-containing protein [Carboxylicivirga sp.]|jgi:transcriptional regulator with XRE-family HTH domain|nr:helix-turn-helix domain-containing protein [Carboxylicivirga sp.]
MDTFGERLKHLIKKSELKTIKEFAEKTGLHKGSVSNIVRGRNNPSYEVIQACMDYFSDAEIIWLLSGRNYNSDLQFENEQLRRENAHFKSKLGTIAKPSSNRRTPRLPFPEFKTTQKVANLV